MLNDNVSALKNQRTVKSYVLRGGRMTAAQAKALQELWSFYGIESDKAVVIPSPAVLEIGFGMGQSLAIQAKMHPEIHYFGIEVHKPGVGSLLLQCQKENIQNVRVFCADAVNVLKYQIPVQAFDKVQIFFPDPWPKKRHHKRRLIQENFIKLLHQKLKPAGILHIATDWEAYAAEIQQVILETALFEKAPFVPDRPATRFENRGKRLGHSIWELVFTAF